MGMNKSESTQEFERRILKMQIKDEIKDEMTEELKEMISDRLQELIGPAVAEHLGSILDFPLTVKQLASLTGRTEANIYKYMNCPASSRTLSMIPVFLTA